MSRKSLISPMVNWSINAFRVFLIKQYPDIFDPSFMEELISLKKQTNRLSEKIALNPNQIYLIRKYSDIKSKPLTIYIFELYFQLGISKKDIQYCTVQNADLEKMKFRKDDNTSIKYNNVIQSLLLKYRNELKNANLNSVSGKFVTLTSWLIKNNAAGEYAESSLSWEDVNYSHSLYIMTCPFCSNKHENIASNWVLVKAEIENDYRLACIQCKGVPNEI